MSLSWLFGPVQSLEIESPFAPPVALGELRRRIVPWGQAGLRGKASESFVALFFVSLPGRNSWRPVFEGRIVATPSGSVLQGSIKLDATVRLLMVVAFAGSLLFTVRQLAGLRQGQADFGAWMHALRGLGPAVFVLALSWLGRFLGSGDRELLVGALRSALAPP